MSYYQETCYAGSTIEITKYYAPNKRGNYTRNLKLNKTTDSMKRTNQRNALKRLRRLLNSNFCDGDMFITVTYKKLAETNNEVADLALKNYLRRLRYHYKRSGCILKYISVTEYSNLRVHHHLVINKCNGCDPTLLWNNGYVLLKKLNSRGNYSWLASYLVKETNATIWQSDCPTFRRWNSSKNLNKPKSKIKKVPAHSWRKEPIPFKGYIIVKDSFTQGVDSFSGQVRQFYMMVKIPEYQ